MQITTHDKNNKKKENKEKIWKTEENYSNIKKTTTTNKQTNTQLAFGSRPENGYYHAQ